MHVTPEDEARALVRLLWRREPVRSVAKKGPKQRLSLDSVIDVATEHADARGLDALTMRALADELGVGPMTVYTYVPTRDVLVSLMVDRVAAQEREPVRAVLLRESLADAVRAMHAGYLAHPWLLHVPPWRDVLGPGRLRRYEAQLGLIEDLPIADVQRDGLLALLGVFAAGSARDAAAARAVSASGFSDDQWWQVVGPELAAAMPSGAFPLSSRVGTAVGEHYSAPGDPSAGFELGLTVLLDGVEAWLANGAVGPVGSAG